jgi:hypothetical protein
MCQERLFLVVRGGSASGAVPHNLHQLRVGEVEEQDCAHNIRILRNLAYSRESVDFMASNLNKMNRRELVTTPLLVSSKAIASHTHCVRDSVPLWRVSTHPTKNEFRKWLVC